MRTFDTEMTKDSDNTAKVKKLRKRLGELDTTLSTVAKTVEKTTKAVKSAGKVTKAVATLLDFDEINRLVEKTVASAAQTAEKTKTKTGQSAETSLERDKVSGLKGFDSKFWTQITPFQSGTLGVPSFWEEAWAKIWSYFDAFRDLLDSRDWVKGWFDRDDILPVGAKLTTTPGELWSAFLTGWGSPVVSIGNVLTSSASTLWSGFLGAWGNGRRVTIGNVLASAASTLWGRFLGAWGSGRSVTIGNTLANTASDLWSRFKAGWSGKTLSLKITYTTAVGAVKTAVYKALGLSGWPKLSFAARGGIVESATLFGNTVVGEAGREAIIPLEHHTEWLDLVADRLSGTAQPIVVQVTLDGRVVGQSTVNYIRSEARAGHDPLAGVV